MIKIKEHDKKTSDDLVNSWLKLGAILKNDRFVNMLSFNETHICNLLLEKDLSLKEIEFKTNMLKSLVNRVINSLTEKSYVKKYKKEDNKKNVWVCLTKEGRDAYNIEHNSVLVFVDEITKNLGTEKIVTLTSLMNETSNIARKILDGSKKIKK